MDKTKNQVNMERVIKFRGIDENGKWIYGYLYQDETGSYIKESDKSRRYGSGFPVDPKTVGQLVGIKNEHGFSVYEGDIIYSDQWNPTTYQVCFDRGAFYIADKDKEEVADIKYAEQFKVIGNVHEHPHLIK